jgi:hypothetical protein
MKAMIRLGALMLLTFAVAGVLQHLSEAGQWSGLVNLGAASLAILVIAFLDIFSGEAANRRRSQREGEGRPKPLV